jgi:hypothetical protein
MSQVVFHNVGAPSAPANQYTALYTKPDGLFYTKDSLGVETPLGAGGILAALAASGGSNLIGFIQAGVGAVARTQQAKDRDTVNVRDFAGVDPLGVLDSTVGLQNALNNGAGPGGTNLPVEVFDGDVYNLASGGLVIHPVNGGGFLCRDGRAIFDCPGAAFTNMAVDTFSSTSTAIRAHSVARPIARGVYCRFTVPDTGRFLCGVSFQNCTDIDMDVEGSGIPNGQVINIDTCTRGDVWEINAHDCTTNYTLYGTAPQITALSMDGQRIGGIGSVGITIHRYYVKDLYFGPAALVTYVADQTDGIHIRGNSFGGTTPTRGIMILGGFMDNVGEAFDILGNGCMVLGGHLRNITAIPVKIGYTSQGNVVCNLYCKTVGWSCVYFFSGAAGAQDNIVRDIILEDLDADGFWTAKGQVVAAVTFNDGVGGVSISGNIISGVKVRGNLTNMQYAVYSKTNTGDVNYVTELDSPAGTLGYALFSNAGGGLPGQCEVHTVDGRILRNATVRTTIENYERGANAKMWDMVAPSGSNTLSFRTRTDLDGAGATFMTITRTGTTVDQILFDATATQVGGVFNPNRYWSTDNQGRVVHRFDDSSAHAWLTLENYGINGVGQGPVRFVNMGTGGGAGTAAFQESIVSTDTWAGAAQRSSKLTWELVQANAITTVLDASVLAIKWSAPAMRMIWDETDAAANERLYDQLQTAGLLEYRTRTDADGAGVSWMSVDRNGTAINYVQMATPIFRVASTAPRMVTDETDAAANERLYDQVQTAGLLEYRTRTDADGAGVSWLSVDRAGTAISYVQIATPLFRLSSTATRAVFDETDAPADERIYDHLQTAGDFERRTRTDVDGAGATFELIQRTGTAVDLIRWNATAMQFGGVSSATRYTQFNNFGARVSRYDDTAANIFDQLQNYGVTGVDQGYARTWQFGTAGALGTTAARERILSTGTWVGGAANQSAKWVLEVTQAGALTQVGEWTTTLLLATTGIHSSHASSKIGYATGAGGAVTQITSKATTTPAINRPSGTITTHNAALAANTTVFFNVANTVVAAGDTVVVCVASGGTANAYRVWVSAISGGTFFTIGLENRTAGSLSEAILIDFAIIKGVTS